MGVNETFENYKQDPNLLLYQDILAEKQATKAELKYAVWNWLKEFFEYKYKIIKRSIQLSTGAIYCLATKSSFDDFIDKLLEAEDKQDLTME
uniref:Uncharacterized protein n=1 Tax=Arion vulgaris TaxID=1028688 RepID=A0A0B7AED1_9EUPU